MQTRYSIQDYIDIVNQGIAKKFSAEKPKKVVIVGAGWAGLSAAHELLRAGHEPLILEAQQRVGGRIYTMRIHFAGEHASLYRAWIQGGFESGLNAAIAIHQSP
jgi:monoamine oxidase